MYVWQKSQTFSQSYITLDITLDVGLKYTYLMCLSLTSGWKLKTLFYWRYTAVDEHGQAKHSSGLNLSLLEDQNLSKFDLNKFSDGLSTTCEGRLFHSVITLWEKEQYLNLELNFFFAILYLWPRVPQVPQDKFVPLFITAGWPSWMPPRANWLARRTSSACWKSLTRQNVQMQRSSRNERLDRRKFTTFV